MNSISEFIINSEKEMKKLGNLLANLLKSKDVITFTGDLGVGKTFLCKSIIHKLTEIGEVPSPTFNIVNTYPFKDEIEIWHCDFYRLENFKEVEEIGIFDDVKKKLFLLNGQSLNKMFFD